MADKRRPTPTPTMLACLYHAHVHGGIKRAPGGFWVRHDFTGEPRWGEYYGTSTIEACKKRGWLKPDDGEPCWKQIHRITEAGIALFEPGSALSKAPHDDPRSPTP